MKIRTGFVSNSSSSSFVVAFPSEPKNASDVKEMMFEKNQKEFSAPYSYSDDYDFWTTDEIAETIWNNIKDQTSNSNEPILEAIQNGWFDNYGKLKGHVDHWNDSEFKTSRNYIPEEYEKIDIENKKRAKKIVDQFKKDNPNTEIYVFEFSDNDGLYFSALEHGDVFRKLKHIQTSYH